MLCSSRKLRGTQKKPLSLLFFFLTIYNLWNVSGGLQILNVKITPISNYALMVVAPKKVINSFHCLNVGQYYFHHHIY